MGANLYFWLCGRHRDSPMGGFADAVGAGRGFRGGVAEGGGGGIGEDRRGAGEGLPGVEVVAVSNPGLPL